MPDITLAVSEPAGGCYFVAGVKEDAFAPLEMKIAEKGVIPTGKREISKRRRHTHIGGRFVQVH